MTPSEAIQSDLRDLSAPILDLSPDLPDAGVAAAYDDASTYAAALRGIRASVAEGAGFGSGGRPVNDPGGVPGYGSGGNPESGGDGYGSGGNPAAGGDGYGTGGNPESGDGYGEGGNPESGGDGYGSGGNPDRGGVGYGAGGNPDRGGNPGIGHGEGDGDGDGIPDRPDDAGNPGHGNGDGTGDGDGVSDRPPPAPTPPDVLVQDPETADWVSNYTFRLGDVTVGFDGETLASNPENIDMTQSLLTKSGVELHPIDSEFGFYVTDFIGAVDKEFDYDFGEGWVGELPDGGGIMVSDARTDTFTVPARLGTWLEGIGGNFVKASTEHYSVMQAILSDQQYPGDESGYYQLDDDLWIVDYLTGDDGMPVDADGNPSTTLVEDVMHGFYVKELVAALGDAAGNSEAAPVSLFRDFDRDGTLEEYHAYMADIEMDGVIRNVAAVDLDRDGNVDYFDGPLNGFGTFGLADVLKPNESSIIEDIAVGDDYSVTLKDDGKLLYRWGNAIKRPNDIRIDAKMDVPDEWTGTDDATGLTALFRVTAAELLVNHTVTNNPNDQVRPEDYENEAAIGQLPGYEVNDLGQWVSTQDFYAGDGTFLPAGTVLRDPALAELAQGTPAEVFGSVQGITGMTDELRTVAYRDGHVFNAPVVFATPVSLNGGDVVSVRFTEVTQTGATFFLEEPEYLNGIHNAAEEVSLLTLEAGNWTLADGSRIEVGTVATDMVAETGFVSVTFDEAFAEVPSVLVQVQTANGADWVVARVRNVTETGFELAMQEQEANEPAHRTEIIGWAAFDASEASGLMQFGDVAAQVFNTGATVDDQPSPWTFDAALGLDPLIAASIASFNGGDPVTLRLDGLTDDGAAATATFAAQEDQSFDDEVLHADEMVTGLALSGAGLLTTGPSDLSDLYLIGGMSSDLLGGFTEAWYTTMDREPFVAVLNEDGTYEIGPRWRLQPDKYGQDLPSVVIPQDPSDPPPVANGEEKYEVGVDTTTVLNLLDWNGTSPLALSAGWIADAGEVSSNGVNMTEAFDVAFYVKGDIKPVSLYDAQLVLSYEPVAIHADGASIEGTGEADTLVGTGSNSFDLSGPAFTGPDGAADLIVLGYGAETAGEIGLNDVFHFNAAEGDALGLIGFDLDPDNYRIHIDQEVVGDDLDLYLNGIQIATLYGVTATLGADDFYFA